MADQHLVDLTENTGPARTDLLYLVADPAGTPVDRKLTVANLLASAWTLRANESGASTTNWTSVAGSWASNGTIIQQTATAASAARLRFTTAHTWTRHGGLLAEAEVRLPTDTGGNQYGGLSTMRSDGTSNGWDFRLQKFAGNWQVEISRPALVERTLAMGSGGIPAGAFNTWYKLRLLVIGAQAMGFIDGQYVAAVTADPGAPETIGLYSYGSAADFRNYKAWTLDLSLPA